MHFHVHFLSRLIYGFLLFGEVAANFREGQPYMAWVFSSPQTRLGAGV